MLMMLGCDQGFEPFDTAPAEDALPWDCEPECLGAFMEGQGRHRIFDLTVGTTGEPLAAGTWRGHTTFVDGLGVEVSQPGLSGADFDDAFVYGLNADGGKKLLDFATGPGVVQINSAAYHRDGVVLGGWRTDNLSLLGKQYDGTTAFVARRSASGGVSWLAEIQSNPTTPTLISGVAEAPDGGVYVTGTVYSGSDFYGSGAPGVSQGHATSNAYEGQAFFAKLSPGGQWQWVQQIVAGATGWSRSHAIAVDIDGSLISGGIYGGPLDWKGGRTSDATDGIFVTRIRPDGEVDWVAPAPGDDEDQAPTITGLSIDDQGKPWAVGVLKSESNTASVTFDALTLTNVGSEDAWMGRMARGGNWEWVGSVGLPTITVELEDGWREFWTTRTALHDIAITPNGRVVVLGQLETREGLDNVHDAGEQVDIDVFGAPLDHGGSFLVELTSDARPEAIRAYPIAPGVSLRDPGVLAVTDEMAWVGGTFEGGFRLGIDVLPEGEHTGLLRFPLRE